MSEPVAKVEKSWDGAVFNITWIGRHDMADGELLYTADAIREAVLAEREACASLIEPKNPRSDWTEYAEAKADCAAMIRARGAA